MDRRIFFVNSLAQAAIAGRQQNFTGLDATEFVKKRGFIGNLIKKPEAGAKFNRSGLVMSVVGALVLLLVLRWMRNP